MENLVIENGTVITPEQERLTSVWLSGSKILHVGDSLTGLKVDPSSFRKIDARDCYVTPGLIDLQMNGGPDCDLWEDLSASAAKLVKMRQELLAHGTTAFLPTLITTSIERFVSNIAFLKAAGAGISPDKAGKNEALARMPGIHLEGPCLSLSRPGVHPAEHIQPFTPAVLKQLMDPSVLLMTAAPESDSDGSAVAFLQQHGVAVSLGHSNATYEEAQRAFNEHKVRLMTHVFNALPPLHHRQPGAVTAALLNAAVTCCLIADGLHLAPAACQLVYALKGKQGTILVTDRAHIGTSGGGLVGSSITLDDAVRNMTRWGITSFAEAIYMATRNPAKALGLDSIGSLAAGKLADVVLFKKEDLQVSRVILGGVEVEIEALISSRV